MIERSGRGDLAVTESNINYIEFISSLYSAIKINEDDPIGEAMAGVCARIAYPVKFSVSEACDGRQVTVPIHCHNNGVIPPLRAFAECGFIRLQSELDMHFLRIFSSKSTGTHEEDIFIKANKFGVQSRVQPPQRTPFQPKWLRDLDTAVRIGIDASRNSQTLKKYDTTGMTPREIKVFSLLVGGLSNKMIGESLQITENTVKVHLQHIYGKLNINNRTQLVYIGHSKV